jgi:hypothetical protein
MLRPAAICDGDITTVERAIAALQQVNSRPQKRLTGQSSSTNPNTGYMVTPDRIQNFMVKVLPKRVVDRTIAGRLGLTKKP